MSAFAPPTASVLNSVSLVETNQRSHFATRRALNLQDGIWQFGLSGRSNGDTLELAPVPARTDANRRMPPGYVEVGVRLTLAAPDTITGEIVQNSCKGG